MPQVEVTERTVGPKLDLGLITGLIAGAVVSVWMLLIGALGDGSSSDLGVAMSSIVLGADVFTKTGFSFDWLIGQVIHFINFAFLGIIFALVWPRIRKYGVLTPAVLFFFVFYFIDVQLIGRIIQPEMANNLGISMLIGYIIAGFVFAYRYRRA